MLCVDDMYIFSRYREQHLTFLGGWAVGSEIKRQFDVLCCHLGMDGSPIGIMC